MQLQDVGVGQRRYGANFLEEARFRDWVRRWRPESLDGNGSVVLELHRVKDNSHPPSTDFAVDGIPVRKSDPERLLQVVHDAP